MCFPQKFCAVLLFFSGQIISPGCVFFCLQLSCLFKNLPSSAQGLQLFFEVCTAAGTVEVHPGLVLVDISAIPRAKLYRSRHEGLTGCLLRAAVIYLGAIQKIKLV